jgi:TonB family protein
MTIRTALLAGSLLLVSSLCARAQSAPESWQRYTVAGEKFSVVLPTLPAMTTATMFLYPSGKKRQEIQLGAYADGSVYQVDIFENVSPRKSLDEFVAERTARWKVDLASVHNIEIGGIPGKEFFVPARVGQVSSRLFATDSRLYHFSVGGATTDDPRAKYFLASIMLGKKQDGIVVTDGPGIPYQQDTGEPPVSGKDVDQKIVLAQKPEPVYTETARQNGVTGTVILKAVFTSAGNVSNIRVVSGLPFGLTEIAVAAARRIKFYPALKDGKRVSMWMQLEYNFDLY